MLIRRFRPLFLTAALALPAAALVVGCSGAPENSPVIRKKFAEVDQMKDSVESAERQMRSVSGDITILKDQVSSLRALAPDESGGADILRKLEEIEQRIARLETGQTAMVAMRNTTGQANAQVERTTAASEQARTTAAPARNDAPPSARRETTTTNTSTAAPAPARPTATEAPATRSTGAALKPGADRPAPKPATSTASRGTYYVIQKGDTLTAIATRNNTSVDAIRRANNIPSGATILPGQRLFIPPQS